MCTCSLYSITITDRKGRTIVARPLGDSTITIDEELKERLAKRVVAARNEGSKLAPHKSAKAFVDLAVKVALKKGDRELVCDILDTSIGNAALLYKTECDRARDAEKINENLESRLIACAGTGNGAMFAVFDIVETNEIISIASFPDWDNALHHLESMFKQIIEEGLAERGWRHKFRQSLEHIEVRCVLPLKTGQSMRGRIVFGRVKVSKDVIDVWLSNQLTLDKGW